MCKQNGFDDSKLGNDVKGIRSALAAFLSMFSSSLTSFRKEMPDCSMRESHSDANDRNKRKPMLPNESEVYNHISKFAKPNDLLAALILVETLIIYWFLFVFACKYDGEHKWILISIATLICGFTRTRLFCLFHDMAHHSFFSKSKINAIGAVMLGWMVYTPYSGWKRGHDYHHRHSNNIDRKQYAQTAPLDVKQYQKLSQTQKLMYKMIYGHWTLVSTTPYLYFMVYQRFISKWYENLMVAIYLVVIYGFGDYRMMLVDLLTTGLGGGLGVFLFHIQHTFEGSYKAPCAEYSRYENGMTGSSYLLVPQWFKFFSASIEYHHIHHLNTRVPLYNLRKCHEVGKDLFAIVPTFTILDAAQRLPYSLRIDETREFISCYDDYFLASAR
mmetsp:Transcript_36130/g.81343  ORF Transcript_36130/g.81343 Transcript_36130/m.81343 type:complete len:386 (-) Transcript_36130:494-1651(-)